MEWQIVRPETVDMMMNIEVDGATRCTFDVTVRRGLGSNSADWRTGDGMDQE